MKTMTFKSKWKTCFTVTVVAFMAAALIVSGPAMAADNQGTGNVADVPGSLNSSNIFSLIPTSMSLNKMAFLNNGTQLTSGDTLPRGTEVKFVIYIDNTTAVGMSDVSIQDVLDPAFAYQLSSMLYTNSPPTGATPAQIYAAVNAGTPATDAINDDVASAVGVNIDVGNGVVPGNDPVDVAPSSVWAIMFRALMQ